MKLKTPLMKAPAGRMFYPGNRKAIFWGVGVILCVVLVVIFYLNLNDNKDE